MSEDDWATALRVGDRVEVTCGLQAGTRGKVNYVNSLSERVGIIPFGADYSIVVDWRRLRRLEEDESKPERHVTHEPFSDTSWGAQSYHR